MRHWNRGRSHGRRFEPGFKVAGLAQELNLSLTKLEAGVDDGEIFVALCDAGFLFIFRSHLRAIGVAAAGLQLQTCCVKLFLRELLLESGNVSLRLKFG